MIIYDLCCDNDHKFEGWFRSANDFDDQIERYLVCCPQCDSHKVHRIPSAVAISSNASEEKSSNAKPANLGKSTALMPVGTQAMALYRQVG